MEQLQKIVYSQIIELRKRRGISKEEAESFFIDKYRLTLVSIAEKHGKDSDQFLKDF